MSIYSNYELKYDSPIHNFVKNNQILPYKICTFYLLCIYFGKKYMQNKIPYNLKYELALWNASLSIFSFIGSIRTTPYLLFMIFHNNFDHSICDNSWQVGPINLWIQLFVLSKIPELFDTFFIIARKKPLIFLHWYHHVTVLLYCWYSYSILATQSLYFISMNYTVHSVMYAYYCLMSLKIKPKWISPFFITIMQITQMIIGMIIQLYSAYKYITDKSCHVNGYNIFWGLLMYQSYFLLFFYFALRRYIK